MFSRIKKITLIILITLFVSLQLDGKNSSQPYVILVSFDGFRWDYLDRGLTPNLDNIIKNGVRSLSLRPVFPSKTFPNHISIVTGLYPENHGIIFNHFENPVTNEKYSLGKPEAVRNSKWYGGEFIWETAKKQGIISASFFWPGSEVTAEFRHPNYYKKYDHNLPYEKRVEGVLEWLKMPLSKRPHFITLYFHETDSQGHDYGPNSKEANDAIKLLDHQIGELSKGLTEIGLTDSVNIIIISDHGMTEINPDKIINVESFLDGKKCKFSEDGPVMMIEPLETGVFELLKEKSENFRVYKREDIPGYYHFSHHPFIYSLILVADPGYSLIDNQDQERGSYLHSKGNHGYDKDFLDMHGIFVAKGPAFKKGFKTGTLWNIDIYPLICEILGILPNQPIDGRSDRIEFILKEN